MKIASLISLGLALIWGCAGCSITRGSRVMPDGSKLQASNYRFLWKSEGILLNTDTNGAIRFEVMTSGSDHAALGVVTEAAVRGAIGVAKP